jgi:hypothetical protein
VYFLIKIYFFNEKMERMDGQVSRLYHFSEK